MVQENAKIKILSKPSVLVGLVIQCGVDFSMNCSFDWRFAWFGLMRFCCVVLRDVGWLVYGLWLWFMF